MTDTPSNNDATSPLSLFERYLSLWVLLCILAGLVLGSLLPDTFQSLAALEYGSVNFVVAVLIWFMVYPMMVSVDFTSLRHRTTRSCAIGSATLNAKCSILRGFVA